MPKRLAVKLKPAAEKIVKQGHPWIFSKSITKMNHHGEDGDLAILFGQEDNQVYAIGLYDSQSPMRIKVIHSGGPAKIDSDFFSQKIENAFDKRKDLLQTDTNAYRLLFGENDGFPGVIVDIYNGVGVLKLYSAAWLPYLEMLINPIVKVSGIQSLVLRLSRKLQQNQTEFSEGSLVYGELENPEVRFKEYGVHFQANVLLGHKTGFFLDHRANRHRIGKVARNKTVLDVFSYAGGFSVHALAGEATEVTSVDISEQALKLAEQNAKLNSPKGKHTCLAGDAFEILEDLISQHKRFDIVIIDPPSFAKSKKEISRAKKQYARLANLGVQLVNPEGLLVLASCSSRINEEEFRKIHEDEFRRIGAAYVLEQITGHDTDHPVAFEEGAYLKTMYYRIKGVVDFYRNPAYGIILKTLGGVILFSFL